MSQAESVANQIIFILKKRKGEPTHKLFFRKIGEVVVDFSMDTSYLFFDFIEAEIDIGTKLTKSDLCTG